jgi:hypothetical protein
MASPIQTKMILCDHLPWDRTNQQIPIRLHLTDADGHPVVLDTPQGPQAIESTSSVEVGRPAGSTPGSMIDASFALTVPPMPLAPGRYEWRLTVGDHEEAETFEVRAGP